MPPSDPQAMPGRQAARPSPAFGAVILVVGTLFFVLTKEIPQSGLTGQHDPGPRALPVVLSVMLMVGGAIELLLALRRRLAGAEAGEQEQEQEQEGGGGLLRMMLLAVTLLIYLSAIPVAGFYLCTPLFAAAAVWWLGARLWSAVLASGAIILVVYVLFGLLFKVQLP